MTIRFLSVSEMKHFKLFDDIPYKYVKEHLKDDNEQIMVSIEELEPDYPWLCKTQFKFDLIMDTSLDSLPVWTRKEFVVIKIISTLNK